MWLTVFTCHFYAYNMIDIWYMYAILDTRWYTSPDSTSNSSTNCFYYCLFMFSMLFQSYSSIYFHNMFSHYMHVLPSPLFLHTHWESDSLNLHIQIHGYWRGSRVMRSLEFSLFDYWYSYFLLFCHFSWFPIY